MTAAAAPRRLFSAYGVELEYMLVDAETLDVVPVADDLLASAQRVAHRARTASGAASDNPFAASGGRSSAARTDGADANAPRRGAPALDADLADADPGDVEFPDVSWSNELCAHLVELKTTTPAQSLTGLADAFGRHVALANGLLAALPGRRRARLAPGAAHPWMAPAREMVLWPHGYGEVYRLLDRMFDCRGHGWSNLQSVHLNLPFHGDARPDDEFGRLHAAIRLLLPLMPALAASSPFLNGRATGRLDSRLHVYRGNAARLPVISGHVVPEPVFTREAYEREIYGPIDAAVAPFDPEGILDHAWMNARGAIARFDRGAIEIRVLDIQECPSADLAVLAAIVEVLRALTSERWLALPRQQAFETAPLVRLLLRTIDDADEAVLDDEGWLSAFGMPGPLTAGAMWRRLVEACPPAPEFAPALETILRQGPLARRLLRAAAGDHSRPMLFRLCDQLADCLAAGEMFRV